MLHQILEHRGIQLVPDFLAVALGHHQAGIPQHGEVPRDGRPAGVERRRDFTGRQRILTQQPQDVAPRLVGECAEDRGRGFGVGRSGLHD